MSELADIARDEWIKNTCDRAHGDNWGGNHRAGFCSACADVYLTLNHVAATVEALKARLRQEVDAHRMTLHEHALPMSDEEFDELLGTIPGFEEAHDAD